ncbi:MAG: cytochrome c biogenesis protein CcdA [bacterium]
MVQISTFASFTAGLLSFLSPCILPLIPAYLSFISGVSLSEMREDGRGTRSTGRVLLNALFFVLGFSLVFVSLGASATVLGKVLVSQMGLLRKAAGLLVIVFGLHTLGVFRIRFLDREKRYHQQRKPVGILGSFTVGLAFAFGWTPCIGPILAAILFYAGTRETIGQGIWLLSIYSAGLGIPFLLSAVGVERFLSVSRVFKSHFRAIEIVSAVLLIAVGVLILTDDLTRITAYLLRVTGGLPSPN